MRLKSKFFFLSFLRLYLPLALIFLVISILFYLTANESRRQTFQGQQILDIQQQKKIIHKTVESILSDLRFLAGANVLEELFFDTNQETIIRIESMFHGFVRNKKIYDQLRLVGADGHELCRVNWNSGNPLIVSQEELQDKSHRYYYKTLITLQKDEIFISRFDLNVENGEVETPRKPMIRFATAVYDQAGVKRGFIILNYLGTHLLGELSNLDKNSSGQILLLNREGFYLRGLVAEDEWGFMFQEKQHVNFPSHFPAEWDRIAGQPNGQFLTQNGLFSFSSIAPLELSNQNGVNGEDSLNTLILVSHVPISEVHNLQHPYLDAYLLVNLVLLLLIGVGSWLSADARSQQRNVERKLAAQQKKFRTVADFTYDWEYWVGSDGQYIYCSPSCRRISGYEADAFLKDRGLLIEMIHKDDFPLVAEHLQSEGEGEPVQIDFRIITAGGQEKWIGHVCQPVYEDGIFLGRRASNRDISLQKQVELELESHANYDMLTKLPNRKLLYERLSQLLALSARRKSSVALLFIDLDKFKEINDTFGHKAGDTVLRETGKKLLAGLRAGDTVARVGGDEFIVVLPDFDDSTKPCEVAEKLIKIISKPIEIKYKSGVIYQNVGASVGISIYPDNGSDIDSLINAADRAMYMAKESGGSKCTRYVTS